jgi:hypothetical protein
MQHDQLAQGAHPFTSTNNAPKTKSIPIMYFINFSDSPNLQFEHAMGNTYRSRQTHVNVLACEVTRPIWNLEGNRPCRCRFVVKSNDGSEAPTQSPQ